MAIDLRFLRIVFWESLENLPLFIGFLLAVKFRAENLGLALVCLVAGTALGAGLIHFTETKKYSNQPSLKETLVNFGVFTGLAIPFVFYLSAPDAWWSNWITDIILGSALGAVLAVAESWGWSNKATVKTHAVSMSIAAVAILISIRLIYSGNTFILVAGGLLLTIIVSIIIAWIDYWPIEAWTSAKSKKEGQI